MSNKPEVIEKIRQIGVLPVIRANSEREARLVIDAVKAGGITTIEVTMTVPNAVSLIENLSKDYGDSLVIGAGTVLTKEIAAQCIDAGAKFIISPAFNLGTIEFCNDREIVVIPGALTPSEILTAWNAGADFVKVFPASALGGAGYIKSVKAPLPQIRLIPTGGVSLDTAADFIKAGAEAVGVGGALVDLKAIRENRAEIITERAQQFLEIVRSARKKN
jgi:2-dehydro-3-deoxyphosphogluconate aldolase / (4S)-4-hydroxy-2-oxoglutarate aldolase